MADLDEDNHFNLVKHGNLRLALKFRTASRNGDGNHIHGIRQRDRGGSRSQRDLLDFACEEMNAEEIRRVTMHEIVTSLSTDTAFNDAIIHTFACRRLAAA